MNDSIHVRPSQFNQLREALRLLLPTVIHNSTDEKWLDLAASLVYNRLASERGPYPPVPAFVWPDCNWQPDELNPGPACPYCAGDMCAQIDGLSCRHDRRERHGIA